MDIISSTSAVVALVFSLATVIKTCKDARGRYKDADRSLDAIRHELEILQAALQELANLMMHDASALSSRWDTNATLPSTFKNAIVGFQRTVKGLQKDFEPLKLLTGSKLRRSEKFNLLWGDDDMRKYKDQIRGQASALNLLLQVLQTGNMSDMKNNLQTVEKALAELSFVTSGSILIQSQSSQDENRTHLLDHFSDLMEFDLLDEGQEWPVLNAPSKSINIELLEKSFTSETFEDSELKTKTVSSMSPPVADSKEKLTLPTATIKRTKFLLDDYCSSEEEECSLPTSSTPPGLRSFPERSQPHLSNLTVKSKVHLERDAENDHCRNLALILYAVTRGDMNQLTAVLESACDIETRHPSNGRTGLILAACFGHITILDCLLKHGADVNAHDRDGRTALHYSASEGFTEVSGLLLSNGALVKYWDFIGETAFHRAVRYGRADVCSILLSTSQASLSKTTRDDSRNALHLAAFYGQSDVIDIISNHQREALLEYHASNPEEKQNEFFHCHGCRHFHDIIGQHDVYWYTPLGLAIASHSAKGISALLRYSASDINNPIDGIVPSYRSGRLIEGNWARLIHFVVADGLFPTWLLREVLRAGANIDLLDGRGQSALFLAVFYGLREQTEILIQHGANFEGACTLKGKEVPPNTSLLAAALTITSPTLLDCLDLSAPANSFATTRGRCVLKEAIKVQRWDIVQRLVKQSSDTAIAGKAMDDAEAIIEAMRSGKDAAFMEWLINNGADPLRRIPRGDNHWYLPIHRAAGQGDIEIAKVLLKHGTDLWCVDSKDNVPFVYAMRNWVSEAAVRWFFSQTWDNTRELPTAQRILVRTLLRDTCCSGIVNQIKVALEMCKEAGTPNNRCLLDKCLRKSISHGRVEATKYLLSTCHTFDGTVIDDQGKRVSAMTLDFKPLDGSGLYPKNHREDFEACRRLVREVTDRKQPLAISGR